MLPIWIDEIGNQPFTPWRPSKRVSGRFVPVRCAARDLSTKNTELHFRQGHTKVAEGCPIGGATARNVPPSVDLRNDVAAMIPIEISKLDLR